MDTKKKKVKKVKVSLLSAPLPNKRTAPPAPPRHSPAPRRFPPAIRIVHQSPFLLVILRGGRDAEHSSSGSQNEDESGEVGVSRDPHEIGPNDIYPYADMLHRVHEALSVMNPELMGGKKFTMIPPQVRLAPQPPACRRLLCPCSTLSREGKGEGKKCRVRIGTVN